MSDRHEKLIGQLTAEAANSPTFRIAPNYVALIWLCAVSIITVTVMWLIQPFRPGLVTQLASSPQFALESVIGLASLILLSFAAIHSSIPGGSNKLNIAAFISLIAWIAVIAYGYIEPALPFTMAGKRESCYLEAVYYSIPATLWMAWLAQRRYTLQPVLATITLVLSATVPPAFFMQLACMHDAHHAMAYHILPILLVSVSASPMVYWAVSGRH